AASTYTAFEYAGSTDNGRRMNRVWKVQNTGVNQEVLIRFPIASVGTTTLTDESCAEYVILFADDEDFTTNLVIKPLTVNEDDYDVIHTFADGYQYFTYARVRPLNPGTVYLPAEEEMTTEYNDECSAGEWTYFHQAGDNTQNLIAFSDYTTTALDEFGIGI